MKASVLLLGLCLGTCLPCEVQAEQCVPFARQMSGVALTGDAVRWWSAASGLYERGAVPKVGAVMVFKPTGQMRLGHVAVVRRLVSRREIRIDHANWSSTGYGRISLDASVIDVSAANDWSQVRVWYDPAGSYGGRTNPVHGFIYPTDHRSQPAPKLSPLPVPQARPVVATAAPSSVQLNAAVLARLRGVSTDVVMNTTAQGGDRRNMPPT